MKRANDEKEEIDFTVESPFGFTENGRPFRAARFAASPMP
jgi:hypothetical protein